MLDPTAESSPGRRERLAPPARLEGATIGLMSISKERSREFLDTIERRLAARGLTVARFEKPTFTKPAPEALIQAMVERCDVVVVGLAD
jgi:nucleotide-binding universal stress UspA family protein